MIIKISIAIVINEQQEILISLRNGDLHQCDKWEFPGGKVDNDETPENAMLRELKEEVGLEATQYHFFKCLDHKYLDRSLSLYFFWVNQYIGIAKSRINQPLKWVKIDELATFDFPAANKKIITAIQKRCM
ncbi:MAG: 8-oxo-dGTP diphosphatase MutT [Psychromonas sp.]|nr:8-oxo-dGTP diphosphatase MutT [Psychromonas sp.]